MEQNLTGAVKLTLPMKIDAQVDGGQLEDGKKDKLPVCRELLIPSDDEARAPVSALVHPVISLICM